MNATPSPDSPMPGDSPRPPQVRASAKERTTVARILSDALSEGRLTMEEFDERTGQAYNARTRAELAALTADLPAPRDETTPASSAGDPHTPLVRVVGIAAFGGVEVKTKS
ncbi:DUF1707 domain-containing protein [Corynebacterium sp.]|uniref:DUF1707 SHOCT-like domain-containing protein n=1 Tax=Corynebacterium sp. TaxID=1720 RepID=UPI0026DDB4F2|nr:DUF1707 domain-containing protein [Corynebacterium sp.]MDO5032115.1 DUF1707 domain-containing protein [Corynebacterium sp.]